MRRVGLQTPTGLVEDTGRRQEPNTGALRGGGGVHPRSSAWFTFKTTNKNTLFFGQDLKTILFGSSLCCFSEEWKLQSFSFSDAAPLRYGIVQIKAGCV